MKKATTGLFLVCASMAIPAAMTTAKPQARAVASAPATAKATVKLSNFQFQPKVLTVTVGTTVEWINEKGRHSVMADDGSFESPTLAEGGRFEFQFNKPGTFAYHCHFHGDTGGKDMAGKVIVVKAKGK